MYLFFHILILITFYRYFNLKNLIHLIYLEYTISFHLKLYYKLKKYYILILYIQIYINFFLYNCIIKLDLNFSPGIINN